MSNEELRITEERMEKTKVNQKKRYFFQGFKAGIPIGMGYFAVSFTLGIAARKAGMSWLQSGFMSAAMLASAGQFAGISAISLGAGYGEMVVTELVVNLRYLLMSSALSQKVRQDRPFFHRFFMAYGVTDEIFAVSMGAEGRLEPWYMYGAIASAAPGWVLGTVMGVLLGMVLPARAMSAMSVALYGMFLAIVVPPSRKDRIIALVVLVSMGASGLFAILPLLKQIPSGFQIMILTIVVAGAAALLFPVGDEKERREEA